MASALSSLVVEFPEDRRDEVVGHMATIASRSEGWLNLSPGLDMDVPPPQRSAFGQLFGSRGPTVPLGTWAPARKREPATLGIQHGEGPQAAQALARAGAAVPEGWRIVQDHPKRGLVVATPSPSTPEEFDRCLAWLLRATGVLCSWPRTGEWRAICYGVG